MHPSQVEHLPVPSLNGRGVGWVASVDTLPLLHVLELLLCMLCVCMYSVCLYVHTPVSGYEWVQCVLHACVHSVCVCLCVLTYVCYLNVYSLYWLEVCAIKTLPRPHPSPTAPPLTHLLVRRLPLRRSVRLTTKPTVREH